MKDIVFIGAQGCGKSSLINKLLDTSILPVVSMKGGCTECEIIIQLDTSEDIHYEVEIEMEDESTMKFSSTNCGATRRLIEAAMAMHEGAEMKMMVKGDFTGIDKLSRFVDTRPNFGVGKNDSLYSFYVEADVVVFVVRAQNAFEEANMAYMKKVVEEFKHDPTDFIICVTYSKDMLGEYMFNNKVTMQVAIEHHREGMKGAFSDVGGGVNGGQVSVFFVDKYHNGLECLVGEFEKLARACSGS